MFRIKNDLSLRTYYRAENGELADICTDGYELENGDIVQYIGGKWVDAKGRKYRTVIIDGELVGFTCKMSISKTDRKIFESTGIGKAYLEYNTAIGGEPFGYCVGMPDFFIDEKFGGIDGLYRECISQNKTWEELLGTDGKWDEIPIQESTEQV